MERLAHQLGEVDRRRARPGHAGVARELVDHPLQRHHLADDDLHPLLDRLAEAGVPLLVLPEQPLGGEADRGQRVLDLVRDPPRRLVPGGELLRLDQLGQVLDHHHAPLDRPAASRRAVTFSSKVFHSPPSVRWISLLPCPPRPTSRTARRQPLAVGIAPGLLERAAHHLLLALAEHVERGAVAGEDLPLGVDRDHARGDVLEHRRDQRPLVGQALVARRQARGCSRSSSSLLLASSSVIRLKESTSTPSSSSATTSTRWERSPPLIRRVPSASAWIGSVTRRAR